MKQSSMAQPTQPKQNDMQHVKARALPVALDLTLVVTFALQSGQIVVIFVLPNSGA